MRPIYATRLVIAPRDAKQTTDVHADLVTTAHRWLRGLAAMYGAPVGDDPWPAQRFTDPPNTCYGETSHAQSGEERTWRGTIVHPSSERERPVAGLRMRTELQVRTKGDEGHVTIRLMIGSATDIIAPPQYQLQPPSLVHWLLRRWERYVVSSGNVEVRPDPWQIDEARMPALIAGIGHPDRGVPIVVISKTREDRPLVDPADVAWALAGLAQVVELTDYPTAFLLTDRFGKRHSVFDGAVRLYWPGFTTDDDPYDHRLFTAERLAQPGVGPRLPDQLLRDIATVAAFRIGSDPRVFAIEREAEQARNAALRRRISELERDRGRGEGDPQALQRENAELRQLVGLGDEGRRNLQDQLDQLQAELEQVYTRPWARPGTAATREDDDEADEVSILRALVECRSLADVVRFAQTHFGGKHIVFHPNAFASAEGSPYRGKLIAAFDLLRAICAVARDYHAGELAGGFREAFKHYGELGYIADISPTARTMYREDYTFTLIENGRARRIVVGPHLRFGSGNPSSSLRIYWHVDEERRRFILCHVGAHLRDGTT